MTAAQGRVLVLNCGSSSLRYRVLRGTATVATGLVEQIGEPGSPVADHETALRQVMADLGRAGLVSTDHTGVSGLDGVGHRVVHGGTRFSQPTRVTDEVVAAIGDLVPLAPLHNPANLVGIEVARRLLPGVDQVAVFDTAFHHTMPAAAATYAIDADLARRLGVRRYGFHGTSHAYVSRRTAALLDRPVQTVNTVTLHLGNGASACAVHGGRSVATSMGLTPLPGLVMGTRTGDLDPAVVFHLHRVGGLSLDEIDDLLNHRGGLAGLCGDNDMRRVLARRAAGDPAATLAFDVYCERIRGYLGAYAFLLGRLDAVSFTAGVGEHAPAVRAAVLSDLDRFGIVVDPDRNCAEPTGGLGGTRSGERRISPDGAAVAVFVIPTDEEQEIATQTMAVLANPAA